MDDDTAGIREAGRAGDVRDVVAARLPGYRITSVALLGEGEDNVAYEVNGELIVRFAKDPDPAVRAARTEGEARLLAAVAGLSPLPVPEPRFTDAERGCLAYHKLPGVPLTGVPLPRWPEYAATVGAAAGELLAALHGAPADRLAPLVETDHRPAREWLDEAAQTYATVAARVPAAHRPVVEDFLGAPPPPDPDDLVFSHNDLGVEHVLVDPATGTVTGVIDWSDAAICDPAYDFGLLYRDLGPAALDRALSGHPDDGRREALAARAAFYARCALLEDLAYGLEPGRDVYLDKSLAALERLYPA
ncbi:aminoglycoside phosphotransferase family protein [Sphaerisporangium album]|uniref:Aminoglycoside phosphotransferase family protein n=1 Tax=Sphaerisporangium album TaxID=509200 RepID=A0A367F4X9_9ACTN|nr:phosphotransferase [Sphaerisporangium album]RCG25403.1 aminoglycoside phosphotransferase family protein [Sphaerisporangium album]